MQPHKKVGFMDVLLNQSLHQLVIWQTFSCFMSIFSSSNLIFLFNLRFQQTFFMQALKKEVSHLCRPGDRSSPWHQLELSPAGSRSWQPCDAAAQASLKVRVLTHLLDVACRTHAFPF